MSPGKRVQRDWPAVLAAQSASGLSVAAFCRQEKIAEGLFYSWRQRGRRASADEGFVELQAVAPGRDDGLRRWLAGGVGLGLRYGDVAARAVP